VFILVMHRVAPDDLAETLQAQGDYFTLSLPLVAEKEETFAWRGGDIIMTRQPGELLHPGRMTPEQLERLKREISPHAFASPTIVWAPRTIANSHLPKRCIVEIQALTIKIP
jgi:hypothetical protein